MHTGQNTALQDFGEGLDSSFKFRPILGGVFIEFDKDKGRYIDTQHAVIEPGAVLFNKTGLFEFAQASQAGGLGQANLSGQFSIADAGIGLEGIKNLYIGAI